MFLKDKLIERGFILCSLSLMSLSASAENLQSAVEKAIAYVPVIKAQEAAMRAAKSGVEVVNANSRPKLQLNLLATNARYDNSSTRGRPAIKDVSIDSYNSEILLTQKLFDFGETKQRVNSAKAELNKVAAEFTALTDVITRNVMIAYIDVQRFERLFELAKLNELEAAKLSKVIDQQVNAGKTAKVDAYLAQSQLSAVGFQVASQKGLVTEAKIRYMELVGQQPTSLTTLKGPQIFPASLNEALETAYATRPQLLAANQSVKAAYANLKAVKATRYPSLDVEMFYREGEDEAAVLGQNDSIGLNLRLSWEIYTGGRVNAEVDQALSQLVQAESTRDDTRRLIDEELRISWTTLKTSIERLVHLEKQHEADERVFKAYQSQLKTGKRTPIDVFVVRRNLNQSRLAMDDGRYKVLTEKYLIKSSMGTLSQDVNQQGS